MVLLRANVTSPEYAELKSPSEKLNYIVRYTPFHNACVERMYLPCVCAADTYLPAGRSYSARPDKLGSWEVSQLSTGTLADSPDLPHLQNFACGLFLRGQRLTVRSLKNAPNLN